jgi:hypothetical protein
MGGVAPLPRPAEAAKQGGHRRALVGEDPDVPLRPSRRQRLGQGGQRTLVVAGRLQGQRLQLDHAAGPSLRRRQVVQPPQ